MADQRPGSGITRVVRDAMEAHAAGGAAPHGMARVGSALSEGGMRLGLALSGLRAGASPRRYRLYREKVILDRFCAKHPIDPDEWALVSPYHIGDVYLHAAMAGALLRHHGGLRARIFTRKSRAFIPALFSSVHSTVTVDPEYLLERLPEIDPVTDVQRAMADPAINKGRFFKPDASMWVMIGYKKLNFTDAMRVVLRLPPEATTEKPRLPDETEIAAARDLIAGAGLEERGFVLFCPDARTTRDMAEIPAGFWDSLASRLSQKGFKVVTNSAANMARVYGLGPLDIPLPMFRAVAMLARGLVLNRSGLCDLVSDLPGTKAVLYPAGYIFNGTLLDGTGLRAMGLADDIAEYEICAATWGGVMESIDQLFP